MDMKVKTETLEVVSFNNRVPDLQTLIELDELDLECVSGGRMDECGTNCGVNCGVNT
jgi:hypothetical protein